MATFAEARAIAKELKQQSPHIRGVELFGSVLKEGVGHDIDIVVLVDQKLAHIWWTDMADDLRVRMGTRWQPVRRFIKRFLPVFDELSMRARKRRRLNRAAQLLGVDFTKLRPDYKQEVILDIFLLPEDWRNGHSANTSTLCEVADIIKNDSKTLSFLEHIARHAQAIHSHPH